MPKCKLKPWKLNEPQVILVNRYDNSKILLAFRKDEEGEIYHEIWEKQDYGGGWSYRYPINEIILSDWKDEFLELLGIPETIEEV